MNNSLFTNTDGTGAARARTSDPLTSHLAARWINTATLVHRINQITDILERWDEVGRHPEYESGYRSKSIANICQIFSQEQNLEVWCYGTLGTVVHRALEAGQVWISGKERHHQSHQLQDVYTLFPPEVRELNLRLWITAQDAAVDVKKRKASETKRRKLEEKMEKDYLDEQRNPHCYGDGTPW